MSSSSSSLKPVLPVIDFVVTVPVADVLLLVLVLIAVQSSNLPVLLLRLSPLVSLFPRHTSTLCLSFYSKSILFFLLLFSAFQICLFLPLILHYSPFNLFLLLH